mgnify:CR=1 FL=1
MTAEKKSVEIKDAAFLFGAPNLEAICKHAMPEVAVIGRSNVGKSTFINRLSSRKLARVSGNPGSTRELNFYKIEGVLNANPFGIALVDMPGFGFAKLSKSQREEISRLAVSFLRERRYLKGVVLLNDCRRLPEEDELAIQHLCFERGISCIVVITKIDALRRSEQQRSVSDIAKAYHMERSEVLVTGEGVSPTAIWERIVAIV